VEETSRHSKRSSIADKSYQMNYQESLAWLDSTIAKGIKLGLDSPRKLVELMEGMPENGARVIHVAGTNGKGSTCAFMESILRAHGKRVGFFSSPHLVKLNERFQIEREEVSDERLASLITIARVCCEQLEAETGHHPTFFEIGVGLAMRYFLDEQVDYILLETGMGGRLDATSVVPADYQVITPIGMDHQEFLGDTLEAIAAEKAGIIRPRASVVMSPQEEVAAGVIKKTAQEQGASLLELSTIGDQFGGTLGLLGDHQVENASVAARMVQRVLGDDFDPALVNDALGETRWAARFQQLKPKQYKSCDVLGDPLIVVDGAHNGPSIEAFLATWKQVFGEQKAILIFGALADKNAETSLLTLTDIAEEIHLVPVDNPRLLKPHALQASLPQGWREQSVLHPSLDSALELKLLRETSSLPIVVIGSLYLAGQALAEMG